MNRPPEQPDLFGGIAAKVAGQELVIKNADREAARRSEPLFTDLVLTQIRELPRGWVGTIPDIKLEFFARGYPPPHHWNAWGAVPKKAVKAGLLVWTGRYEKSKIRIANARPVCVWRRL